MYRKETVEAMKQDEAEWSRKREENRARVAIALEGVEDDEVASMLRGFLQYGWRRPNGEWRKTPVWEWQQREEQAGAE